MAGAPMGANSIRATLLAQAPLEAFSGALADALVIGLPRIRDGLIGARRQLIGVLAVGGRTALIARPIALLAGGHALLQFLSLHHPGKQREKHSGMSREGHGQ